MSFDFSKGILKTLTHVHPNIAITDDALDQINQLINVFGRKIMRQVNLLLSNSGDKTLNTRDLQSGVRLAFPGEIGKHAISEGFRAATKFNSSFGSDNPKHKVGKDEKQSQTKRSGLLFSVSTAEDLMMSLSIVHRKTATSAVFFAAALEYMATEILELSGNAAGDTQFNEDTPEDKPDKKSDKKPNKKSDKKSDKKAKLYNEPKGIKDPTIITQRTNKLAILNDEELSRLMSNVDLSGGILSHIDIRLITKSEKTGKKTAAKD